MIKRALFFGFALTATVASVSQAGAQVEARPNILVIVTDDQRKDMMTVMESTRAIFDGGGTRYRNGVATTPLCCPSRSSIFSGQYVHNHGVTDNTNPSRLDQTHTIQYQLQQAGYFTALNGKYLNGWNEDPPYFDRWNALSNSQRFFDGTANLNGTTITFDGYQTTWIARQSAVFLNFFEENDDRPWMMQVSPGAPHVPATTTPRYEDGFVPPFAVTPSRGENVSDKYRYVKDRASPLWQSRRTWTRMNRSLYPVDNLIAVVFRQLESRGEADNTLAFFLSDNGFQLYEHNVWGKVWPYAETLRIPFYARWPGHISAGAVERKVVANIDLAPTIYEAARVTPDYVIDGQSLFSSERTEVYTEMFPVGSGGIWAWDQIWSPREQYIRYPSQDKREAYEMDPYQTTNLFKDGVAGNEPDSLRYDALLDRFATCAGSTCP
ncbi:MAG: sulfatase-like hydrolase/transferase [Actinomycetota bacterium]|nr:sulfatase-like hydrolase/transferase [Actinomycetota bacterium]